MVCFKINKFTINILCSLISIIVILFSIFFTHKSSKTIYFDIVPSNNLEKLKLDKIQENIIIDKNINNKILEEKEEWKIEIPRIELIAEISEGTSSEILDNYVGHFEETKMWDGNIGLAAHNRGYKVNYFQKIKELETGDEILYTYNKNTRKYIVKEREVIKETDWSYLEETEDNRLTLITCVEDLPEYRRCIQAIEYKEE